MTSTDPVRIDTWLWSIRIFRSRTQANAACATGRVRLNGSVAKAAKTVEAGDRIELRVGGRERVLEVVSTPRKRLGAQLASEAYRDHSPPPPSRPARNREAQAVRDPGSGRPTKRDRRRIDELRGR